MRTQFGNLKRLALGDGLGSFLVRAMAGSGVAHGAGMLVSFLVGVQLARGLGVDGYGQYGIAMAVIAIASIPGEFGLPRLVTREVAGSAARSDLPRLYGVLRWADRTAAMLSVLTAAVVAIAVYLAISEVGITVATAILVGLPIIPIVALTKVRSAGVQGLHHIVLGQIPINLLRPLFLALMLLVLFYALPSAGAAEAMALNVLSAIGAFAAAHIWLRTRLPHPRPASVVEERRRWTASSFPMALAEGMKLLQAQLTILLLGIIAAPEQVGLFRIATAIFAVVGVPMVLVNSVISPVLARLHAEDDARRLQQLCTHSAQLMTVAVVGLFLPILLLGPDLLGFIFGSEFAPAYPSLVVLCIGLIVDAWFGPSANLLTMTGHEKLVTRAMLIGLVGSLVLTVLLVPQWGELGAAWAMVGAIILWKLATWIDCRRLLSLDTSLLPFPMKS